MRCGREIMQQRHTVLHGNDVHERGLRHNRSFVHGAVQGLFIRLGVLFRPVPGRSVSMHPARYHVAGRMHEQQPVL